MLSFLVPDETLFILRREITKSARETLDVSTVFDLDVVGEVPFEFEWFCAQRTLNSVVLTLLDKVTFHTPSSIGSCENFTTSSALVFPLSMCL